MQRVHRGDINSAKISTSGIRAVCRTVIRNYLGRRIEARVRWGESYQKGEPRRSFFPDLAGVVRFVGSRVDGPERPHFARHTRRCVTRLFAEALKLRDRYL